MFAVRAPGFPHRATSRLVQIPEWPRLPSDLLLYKASMVATDSRGLVYVTHRGPKPLLCLDPDGTLRSVVGEDVLKKSAYYAMDSPEAARTWVEDAFNLHGVHVDPWDHVWVTDFGRHLVVRFDPRGAVDRVLGTDGEPGDDERHFNQPTHAVVAPNGDVFVSDGYVNSRIVKFDRHGKFLSQWGSRGTEPGQFHTPHALVLDPAGRLFVSDRENDRIQIFDLEGGLLEVWGGLRSVDGLARSPDGTLYGASGSEAALLQFGPRGEVAQAWSDPSLGPYPSRMLARFPNGNYPHGAWVDRSGALYIAETSVHPQEGSRILKFIIETP